MNSKKEAGAKPAARRAATPRKAAKETTVSAGGGRPKEVRRSRARVDAAGARSLGERLCAAPFVDDRQALEERLQEMTAGLTKSHPLRAGLRSAQVRGLLMGLAAGSPYLWQLCVADPDRLAHLFATAPEQALEQALSDARARVLACGDDDDEAMRILRDMKQTTHLLIALADIGGVWSLDEVVDALARMADCAVSSTLAFLLLQAANGGKLALPDRDNPEQACGVVVFALGKHGAGELNYSSDVDLIVFFDPQSPAIPEGVEPAPLFVRLTRQLVRMLQERTGDGYVLRVDLRLRPDPGSTSVAISLPAAFSYYESVGQNWERAAFIKARAVAGDQDLGARFIADLAPFIWRKYFDYAAIADIHAMKRQIHAVRGHGRIAIAGHDIKLGRGGIREVEFFVQTQQLIFGGRRPQLRGRKTLDMLQELSTDGWVTQDAVEDLSTAYRFIRTIEHRLQMQIDEQTQRLPADAGHLDAFAKFCGFPDVQAFSARLTLEMEKVERHYARLFEHAPTLSSSIGNLVFTGSGDDPETLETLRALGFADPSRAIETIRGWHFGRRVGMQGTRAREVMTELAPSLIEAFAGSGDADAALAAFDEALGHMPASVELLSILKSNDAVRQLFGDILGAAPRLANVITQRPHVLDAAIDPSLLGTRHDEAYFLDRARRIPTVGTDTELVLDAMRDMALEEMFLIGMRILSNAMDPDEAGRQYSALADALVGAALGHLEHVFACEYGKVPGGRCAILGLGKLGSREMTATSDLDLILLYDFDDENSLSDGARAIHANQYYARLTQRLLSALTVPTRRGPLYEVDMRLRPSGRQGPVATNIHSFEDYQLRDAETWERMALSRARVIAGDRRLGEAAAMIVRTALTMPRDENALKTDVLEMRRLIAVEKGEDDPWDLKLVSGGLIDIEFIAQFLSLRHAAEHPELLDVGTWQVLKNMQRASLLDTNSAEILMDAHRFYSAMTQTLRLAVDGPFDPKVAAAGVLRRIASSVALPDFRTVEREVESYRAQVRPIFLDLLE